MSDITLAGLSASMLDIEGGAAKKLSEVISSIQNDKKEGGASLADMLTMQRAWGEYSLTGEIATNTLKQHIDVMAEAARKS